MGFGDKLMKGLQDATRATSDQQMTGQSGSGNAGMEIEKVKMELGHAFYMAYLKGEPVDDAFLGYCKRIDNLSGGVNNGTSQENVSTEPAASNNYELEHVENGPRNGPL